MYYILGHFDTDINCFDKSIPKEDWNRFISMYETEDKPKIVKYYTLDKCYSKQGGQFFVEDTQEYNVETPNILKVMNRKQPIDYFPLQLKYNNKQVCYTKVAPNGLQFSQYNESGKTFYEVSSSDMATLSSLSLTNL